MEDCLRRRRSRTPCPHPQGGGGFRQRDPEHDIPAVRNFYAGVLLLAKEALIRKAPAADPMLVIGAKSKPVPDGAGGIEMAQVGHSTIDFRQIGERAADFGIAIDHKALQTLNRGKRPIRAIRGPFR